MVDPVTYLGSKDFLLEVARGNVAAHAAVNKFGQAPSGVQTTATDIWDRADATPTQQVWVAPTAARVHQITSTSTSDTSGGAGAKTLRVYGLTGWGTAEANEDITMNGTSNVATSSSYVIIHRMKVLTKGATNANVGTITATADTDSTVTAQINVGEGQTMMAIYGVPSTQTAYVTQYYASLNKASGAAATVNNRLLVNPEADTELLNFLVKHTIGTQSTGVSHFAHEFLPPFAVPGPAIIKISGIGSGADLDVGAGFDLVLVDN